MSKLIKAQIIANYLWYAGGPKQTPKILKNKIPESLEITTAEVDAILESTEYLVAVKHLMMISRTPKQRIKWVDSWNGKLHHLAIRMALSWDDTAELMTAVHVDTLQETKKELCRYETY